MCNVTVKYYTSPPDSELTLEQQHKKLVNKKWVVQILFTLHNRQKLSYKLLKNTLCIPNATMAIRLDEMVKLRYLERFVYGSISKPHYTDYQITDFGVRYVDEMVKDVC